MNHWSYDMIVTNDMIKIQFYIFMNVIIIIFVSLKYLFLLTEFIELFFFLNIFFIFCKLYIIYI